MKLPEHGPLQYAVMDGHLAGGGLEVQLMTLPVLDRLQCTVMDGHLAGSESGCN
jgi:hypothetical protein